MAGKSPGKSPITMKAEIRSDNKNSPFSYKSEFNMASPVTPNYTTAKLRHHGDVRHGSMSEIRHLSIPTSARDGHRRFSYNDFEGNKSPTHVNYSQLNNEQVIDLMEREQDGIVLKLIKEIEALKQENQALKMCHEKSHSIPDMSKKMKRKLSNEMSKIDENVNLKRENERLKQEIEFLNEKLKAKYQEKEI